MCEDHICKDFECFNGSNCTVDSSDQNDIKPRCDCLYGFDGIQCEQDLCNDIHCYNDGICIIHENESSILEPGCNCTNQFVGENCNIFRGCEGDPCQNDGDCELLSYNESIQEFIKQRINRILAVVN